jgi:hypothetical protein
MLAVDAFLATHAADEFAAHFEFAEFWRPFGFGWRGHGHAPTAICASGAP